MSDKIDSIIDSCCFEELQILAKERMEECYHTNIDPENSYNISIDFITIDSLTSIKDTTPRIKKRKEKPYYRRFENKGY